MSDLPDGMVSLGDAAAAVVGGAIRPAVQRIPIADRASWLKHRERDVTASTVGALLGAHDYQTAYSLWALKTGAIIEDPDETPPMRRGRLLEPVAMQLLREQHPTWTIENPGVYLRDSSIRLGATPDAFATDPARTGIGVIQFKTVEPSVFRRKWLDEDGVEVTPPLWIVLQALTEAHLAGATWAAVVPMRVGFGLDIDLIDIPLHAGAVERIRGAVAEFWAMVESGKTPEPDWRRDASLAAQLMPAAGHLDLSQDNALPSLLAERADIKMRMKADKERCDEIEAEVKAKVGSSATAALPGWKITFKPVERSAYSVAATTTRPLRINPTKDRAA